MKIKSNFNETRWDYSAPEVERVEIPIEMGFALSGVTEDVGKDDEVDF